MVERRATDPVRIAQLLASEVTGRTRGPLAPLEVVDADRDAAPAAGGTLAYRLAVAADGDTAGTVTLYPDHVRVSLAADGPLSTATPVTDALPTDREAVSSSRNHEGIDIEVGTGAAVKPVLDGLRVAAAGAGADGATDEPA